MLYLPALLAFLAASPALEDGDVDPLAIYDPATRAIWRSEVQRGWDSLECRLTFMPLPDDSAHGLIEVIFTAVNAA